MNFHCLEAAYVTVSIECIEGLFEFVGPVDVTATTDMTVPVLKLKIEEKIGGLKGKTYTLYGKNPQGYPFEITNANVQTTLTVAVAKITIKIQQ